MFLVLRDPKEHSKKWRAQLLVVTREIWKPFAHHCVAGGPEIRTHLPAAHQARWAVVESNDASAAVVPMAVDELKTSPTADTDETQPEGDKVVVVQLDAALAAVTEQMKVHFRACSFALHFLGFVG